ncbi:MAG: L-alanine-DL-glutamate epimerase [bacterium]|nr:L-alanine-DL-glutamate epimerase [bacterium]
MKSIQIERYAFNFEREPFVRPFHFKGGSFSEKWILVTSLESTHGVRATGIGGTAVLWSDPSVFFAHSEAGGNIIMAAMAERAVELLKGKDFRTPFEAIDSIFSDVHSFGKTITGNDKLSETFTLNALVSLDLALWKLHAYENEIRIFDELLPEEYRNALSHHQEKLSHVPLIPYNYPLDEIVKFAEAGYFFFKIKIGHAGTPEEMLRKDISRLREIHQALKEKRTPHTSSGKLLYYLDANGRYPEKSGLLELLDHVDKMGMLEQVALLEEPFPEDVNADVSNVPVRVAADESLHRIEDVQERIDLGYRAIALKPAGKTLSMTLRMASYASTRNIPCFVADSACVPLLRDWNLNVACRLPEFPGLDFGFIEANGVQQYKHWRKLIESHPCCRQQWVEPSDGFFRLDSDFYGSSGGIFLQPGHYEKVVNS